MFDAADPDITVSDSITVEVESSALIARIKGRRKNEVISLLTYFFHCLVAFI